MILDRAGERAFDVAEQFAFQKFLGKARTTDGDKWFVRQMAFFMDGAGGDTFARAALAVNQNGSGRFCGAHQNVHGFLDGRRGKIKNRFESLRFDFGDLLLQPLDAPAHLIQALQPRQHGHELLALKRLFEKIHRAAPHGFDGGLDAALRGEHDDGRLRKLFLDFRQNVQAVFLAKIDIQQDGVPFILFEPVQS